MDSDPCFSGAWILLGTSMIFVADRVLGNVWYAFQPAKFEYEIRFLVSS